MLEAAHLTYGDQVLFIGVVSRDDRDAALRFLADFGTTYPQVFDSTARFASARRDGHSVHRDRGLFRHGRVPAVRHDHVPDAAGGAGRRRDHRRTLRLKPESFPDDAGAEMSAMRVTMHVDTRG